MEAGLLGVDVKGVRVHHLAAGFVLMMQLAGDPSIRVEVTIQRRACRFAIAVYEWMAMPEMVRRIGKSRALRNTPFAGHDSRRSDLAGSADLDAASRREGVWVSGEARGTEIVDVGIENEPAHNAA